VDTPEGLLERKLDLVRVFELLLQSVEIVQQLNLKFRQPFASTAGNVGWRRALTLFGPGFCSRSDVPLETIDCEEQGGDITAPTLNTIQVFAQEGLEGSMNARLVLILSLLHLNQGNIVTTSPLQLLI